MSAGALGRVYQDGEVIVHQGDSGDCLYVVQEGEVEVVVEHEGRTTLLRVLGTGEVIGEMAIFEHVVRSATVRARRRARLLTIDKKNFLRRISEDPSIAFRLVESLSRRVRDLSDKVVRLTEQAEERAQPGP